MEFLGNLFKYLVSININAFNTVWYFLSRNWFILGGLFFVVIFIIFEIKMKSTDLIDDNREMF